MHELHAFRICVKAPQATLIMGFMAEECNVNLWFAVSDNQHYSSKRAPQTQHYHVRYLGLQNAKEAYAVPRTWHVVQ